MASSDDGWDHEELELYLDLTEGLVYAEQDPDLQRLFDEALFSPEHDDDAYQELVDYVWEAYHMDFEDIFDWDGYREWYDAA